MTMKKILKTVLFTIATVLIFVTPAKAGLYVGGGFVDLRIGNDEFRTVKDYEPLHFYHVGYYKELKNNWTLDVVTNLPSSVMSDPSERTIIYNNTTLFSKNNINYGSLLIGKKISKNTVASLSASYVRVNSKVYFNKNDRDYLSKDIKEAAVFGGDIKYFIGKNKSASVSCLLPNTTLDLKFSCGASVNYYFN